MQRGSDKHSAWKDDALARGVEGMIRGTGPTHAQEWKDPELLADDPELITRSSVEDRGDDRSAMSSAELPDADAIDQQMLIDDAEDRDDNLRELPLEVDPADAVEQHSRLGGDDAEDYYPRG